MGESCSSLKCDTNYEISMFQLKDIEKIELGKNLVPKSNSKRGGKVNFNESVISGCKI